MTPEEKIRRALTEFRAGVLSAAEQKLGRVLSAQEKTGIERTESLMMLESCERSFTSSNYPPEQVEKDLACLAERVKSNNGPVPRKHMTPEPPANPSVTWYAVINIPAGLLWGLGLPVLTGVMLNWHWGVIAPVAVLWLLLNSRIMDRHIPALTDPFVRFAHRLLTSRGKQ